MDTKLLIVDDDPRIIEVLSIYMEDYYDIYTATDGEEALETIKKQKPDVIVLDIMMPGMNGYELAKRLKTKREYNAIPIIMLTALDKTPNKVKGYRVGANRYITKPFSFEELKNLIDEVLIEKHKEYEEDNVFLRLEFDMQSEMRYFQEVNELISNLYSYTNLDDIQIQDIHFVLNEVISNAVEHGNQEDSNKIIHIRATLYEDRLLFEIEDEGEGFDIEQVPDPTSIVERLIAGEKDIPELNSRERPGGWGLYMIKAMADKLEFNEKGNKVTLTKLLPKPISKGNGNKK